MFEGKQVHQVESLGSIVEHLLCIRKIPGLIPKRIKMQVMRKTSTRVPGELQLVR